ncbi:hypothetical protein DXX93_17650 [Thalassotalea euphylliae]|uniref:Uncharacterized protein n=1 Tax=Thalassotalea euphylliae TaxID=1655234 RepID=A0A3E0TU57_9GAMM|nr:hypothetical protein [Thalassotalea euphylliae]REL28211.1 hypothetical protein DXX93_17650 [Thalassotalea euphylliae]
MLDYKNIIFYAVIPALIAGLFTLIPKIYDEVSEPEAKLEYSVLRGPSVEVSGQNKWIVMVKVENTGKKILSNVVAHIESSDTLEAIELTKSSGLSPQIDRENGLNLRVNRMHSNDFFTVSLMLTSSSRLIHPKIALRSDEVLGNLIIHTQDSSEFSVLGFLIPTLSVFIVASLVLRKSENGRAALVGFDKINSLFYIAAKMGISDIVQFLNVSDSNTTYLRFADLLVYKAINDESQKDNVIKGLKSLLLIGEVADSTIEHIERHIENLEEVMYNSEEIVRLKIQSHSIETSLELRNAID